MNNRETLIDYNYYEDNSYKYKSSTKTINNKLDFEKTIALKNIIEKEYGSKTTWTFKKEGILNYTIILINSFEHSFNNHKQIVNYKTHISFTGENFSIISFTSFIYQNVEDKNLQKIIQDKNKEIRDKIKNLYKEVINAILEDNYYFEFVQLCYGSVSGFYDFGRLKVDGGEQQKIYDHPEILKIKVKYKKIIVSGIKNTCIINDTMKTDRLIARNLIQLLLRFPIEDKISDGYYYTRTNFISDHNFMLDINNEGKMYNVDRNNIINNDHIGFPFDSKAIIDKFYSLNYKDKNTFIQSCVSYANGLKSKSEKAIAYFALAIENVAIYYNKTGQKNVISYNKKRKKESKKDIITKIINEVFNREIVSKEYINIIYKIRSSHFHNGIENSDILMNGFEIEEGDINLVDSAERLAHSFLIQWLIKI